MSNVLYAVLASVLIINAVLYANVSDNYVPETIILSPHPTLQPTCHPIPHPTARPSRPPAPRPTLSPTPKPTIPPSKPHALSSGASTAWTRSNHAASQPRTSSSSSSSYVRRAFFGLVLVAAAVPCRRGRCCAWRANGHRQASGHPCPR
ncbi:hypothetical protein CTAYLR_001215 [Chrysophaeum taylorii]|uniref:Uncharacterized protein n=1 Tax=Chrysophaeum taylorii TaxID=2483200 RepID=A0AAD7XI55_9STRA|nr:hypothetical protein CTAYLR_001215 [Chrysophaeum taylorii]